MAVNHGLLNHTLNNRRTLAVQPRLLSLLPLRKDSKLASESLDVGTKISVLISEILNCRFQPCQQSKERFMVHCFGGLSSLRCSLRIRGGFLSWALRHRVDVR